MRDRGAFWDSSALVPLCIEQRSSHRVRTLLTQLSPTVWWAAEVEVHSAIARLRRHGELDQDESESAKNRLHQLKAKWDQIAPSDALRSTAESLLRLYPLRAGDSLQLAAALTWCRNRPAGRTFLCADTRLSEAAARAGFDVVSP